MLQLLLVILLVSPSSRKGADTIMLQEERIYELIEFNMAYGHSDVSELRMGPIYQSLGSGATV